MAQVSSTLKQTSKLAVMAALFGASLAGTAQAQSTSPEALLQCDKIKDPEDRLACFNTIVEKLKENPDSFNRGKPGGHAGRDGKARSSGDFSSDFGKSQKREAEAKSITAGVKRYWQNAHGKYYFYLDNGQIWKETSGSKMRLTKKVEQVRIKKGLVGGYKIMIKGANRPGRVKRVD